jgi:hypothetical protein
MTDDTMCVAVQLGSEHVAEERDFDFQVDHETIANRFVQGSDCVELSAGHRHTAFGSAPRFGVVLYLQKRVLEKSTDQNTNLSAAVCFVEEVYHENEGSVIAYQRSKSFHGVDSVNSLAEVDDSVTDFVLVSPQCGGRDFATAPLFVDSAIAFECLYVLSLDSVTLGAFLRSKNSHGPDFVTVPSSEDSESFCADFVLPTPFLRSLHGVHYAIDFVIAWLRSKRAHGRHFVTVQLF